MTQLGVKEYYSAATFMGANLAGLIWPRGWLHVAIVLTTVDLNIRIKSS